MTLKFLLRPFLLAATLNLFLSACDNSNVSTSVNGEETKVNLTPEQAEKVKGSTFYLTSENGQKVWPVFKVKVGENVPKEGYLWTNIANTSPEAEIIAFPHPVPFYDISLVGYSQGFADTYGFPKTLVINLSKGNQVLEFRIKTERATTQCYINMLLDKNQELYFPDEIFHDFSFGGALFWWHGPLHLPFKPKDFEFHTKFEEKRKEIMGSIENEQWEAAKLKERAIKTRTIFLVSDYDEKGNEPGGHLSVFLRDFHPSLYPGYDYISVNLPCGEFAAKYFEGKNPQIWIKKDSAADYGKIIDLDPKEFSKFNLPKDLFEKIVFLMTTINPDVYKSDTRLINEFYYPENQLGQDYYKMFDQKEVVKK